MKVHFIDTYKQNSDMMTYSFSPAQRVFFDGVSDEKIEELRNIIIAHFRAKRQKYRLVQDIFYNQIGIDNYLFAELCYCKSIEDEKQIVEEYYYSFDNFESISELDRILDTEYLNSNPELKNELRQFLIISRIS